MPFPLAKDYADPEQVTTIIDSRASAGVGRVLTADFLVRQVLTASAALTVINRSMAVGARLIREGGPSIAQRIRLSTLPPYFTVYVPPKGGGGGGTKRPHLPETPRAAPKTTFIGRTRDRNP